MRVKINNFNFNFNFNSLLLQFLCTKSTSEVLERKINYLLQLRPSLVATGEKDMNFDGRDLPIRTSALKLKQSRL